MMGLDVSIRAVLQLPKVVLCREAFKPAYIAACLVVSTFAFSTAAQANPVGLVVTGIGGNADYEEQFKEQGEVVVEALRSISETDSDFVLLQSSDATREAVLSSIEQFAAKPASAFYLVLLGHGSVDSETWRFNLSGEDLTTEDLVASLAAIDSEQQLVVVGTSGSGAVLEVLSQPGRHVVTATKSAGELNAVRFPEFFAKAMGSSVADVDRNEILTLAEAYRYSNEQTQNYYLDKKLLASEHARIASDEPARLAMARLGSLKTANDDPVVAELLDQRLVLEENFLSLKARKPDMETTAYYAELETLLVSIALLQQEIDTATGWVGGNE